MFTVGPELPAHLVAKRKRQAKEEEKSPVAHSRNLRVSRSPSSDGADKRRRVIGPSLPPANFEEQPSGQPEDDNGSSSDDDFGPALPAGNGSDVDAEVESMRIKAIAEELARAESAKKTQRDGWMLVPPKQDDWSSRVDPTKLRNRKFNTGKSAKAPPRKGDEGPTVWTETPEQKRQRLEDEVMGIRKPAALDSEEDKRTAHARAEAEQTARKIKDYNVKNRHTSLYDEHKTAVPKEKEDDPSKRAFDREKDIGGGMKIGHAQKKEMLNRAADFGSRFAGGNFL